MKYFLVLILCLSWSVFAQDESNKCLSQACPIESKTRNPIDVFKEVNSLVDQELKANTNLTDECRTAMAVVRDAKIIDGEDKANTADNISKVVSDFPTLIEKGCFRDGYKAAEIGLHLFDSVGRNLVQANKINDFNIGPWTITANAAGVIISGISRLGLSIMKWMGLQKKERSEDDPLKEIVAAKHQENLMQSLCDYRKLVYLYDQNKLSSDEVALSKEELKKIEDQLKDKKLSIANSSCKINNSNLDKVDKLGKEMGSVLSFPLTENEIRRNAKACNDLMELDKKNSWMSSVSSLLCQRLDCQKNHQACQFIPSLVQLKILNKNQESCDLNPNWKNEISCFDTTSSGKEKVLQFISNIQLLSDAIPSAISSIKESSSFSEFIKLTDDKKLLELQAEQIKSRVDWQESIHRNSTEMSLRGLSQYLLNTNDVGFLKYANEKSSEINVLKENSKSKIYNLYTSIDEETVSKPEVSSRLINDINYIWMQYNPAQDHLTKIKKVCETFLNPCQFKTKGNRFTNWLSSNQTINVAKTDLETSQFEKTCLGFDYKNQAKFNFCQYFKDSCKSEGRGSKSPSKYQETWNQMLKIVNQNQSSFDNDFLKSISESENCDLSK